MSDQAKFNGIDDGSRSKAINLKLKKDKKRGVFGQVSAGYGSDERFIASARANFFKGATQVGVFANANNTNRVGFYQYRYAGPFRHGRRWHLAAAVMGGGGGNFGVRRQRHYFQFWSAGINYNDIWSKHFEINGNYNFNHTGNENLPQKLPANACYPPTN